MLQQPRLCVRCSRIARNVGGVFKSRDTDRPIAPLRYAHPGQSQQKRFLSLHEYQSHSLLREYGVPVPNGKAVRSLAEAKEQLESLGGTGVIKAQILKGGRGQGTFDNGFHSGIHAVKIAEAGIEKASNMLGHRLRTAQTGLDGPVVKQLYIVEEVSPSEEWYLAITVDRENYCPVVIISKKGGGNIEEIARNSPGDVHTFPLNYNEGVDKQVLDTIQHQLSLSPSITHSLKDILQPLWSIFKEKDATLLELNPLALLPSQTFLPLDAKFTFDDASARRQSALFALRDAEHEVSEEVEAEKYGLVYVRLEGNIGNVVNGAGLAMATNDAIGLHGGKSANFLDAGGQATKETMMQAFRIILADERVTAILVNIYGGKSMTRRRLRTQLTALGITKCDMIAKSIIGAASELGPMKVPIVARLQGTNSAEGLKLLEEADLGIHVEAGFGEAAKKAVELANPPRI
ncbi:ATP-grasp domain-containing protein [Sarocladium implicatum]|nr:ATP-grasp domain-containing protein [Sarocladium implicatum]